MRPTAVSTNSPFQDGGRLYDVITTKSWKFYFLIIRSLLPWNPKQLILESKPNSSYNNHAYIILNHFQAKASVIVVVNKVKFPYRSLKGKDYCKLVYSKYKE